MEANLSEYLKKHLREGHRKVLIEQAARAQNSIYGKVGLRVIKKRTGVLMKSLREGQPVITGQGLEAHLEAEYPVYTRMLDMKEKGNHKIYNRPIWGILYKQTLIDMKYEYKDWLRSQVEEFLKKARQ